MSLQKGDQTSRFLVSCPVVPTNMERDAILSLFFKQCHFISKLHENCTLHTHYVWQTRVRDSYAQSVTFQELFGPPAYLEK
jgi:hypothetical protein